MAVGQFVKFKKSRWHRAFEKGEMTKAEALDTWHKARDEWFQAEMTRNMPCGGPTYTRPMTAVIGHDFGYVNFIRDGHA